MQREIKFKAWDMLRQKMCSVDSIEFVDFIEGRTGINVYTIENKIKDSRWIADGNFKLIQYTGLKDSKGVEIYEGDILEICNGSINGVKWTEPNLEVKYRKAGFNLHEFMWDKDGNSAMDSTHYCTVIGTVFENPELINQVK